MKNKTTVVMAGIHLVMLTAVILLFAGASGHVTDSSFLNKIRYIDTFTASVDGGPKQEVTLPYSFRGLKPRTKVVLETEVDTSEKDALYMKSVYSPARIYINGQLTYEFGIRDEYPDFMKDPATEVHIIESDQFGDKVNLRMDFLSPVERSVLTVHPPMTGTQKNIIFNLFHKLGLPLIFSMLQIIGGLALIFVSICICFIDKKGILFLWLGLFSLDSGLWSFGENNFSALMIKNPTFLYLLAFTGLFTFIVPLLHFTRVIIDFENPMPVYFMEVCTTAGAALALILQYTGTVSCSKSLYVFHWLLPAILLILTFLTIKEYIRYKNVNARRFIFPICILMLSALLELLNYHFKFTYVFSSLFQIGILFFLLTMGLTAGLFIKDSINLKNKQKELSFEKDLMAIQIREQQKKSDLLAHKEEILRRQRHDLRHQLTAIQGMSQKNNTELQEYLQSLMDQIPTGEVNFCENTTVNSIIAHYDNLCKQKEIELSLQLTVPSCSDHILESELCVIFGNLLENAVEACDRMTEKKRFIRLNSTLHYDTLIITMDNSFNGIVHTDGDRYFSSKRNDYGIGLASICSVARKFGGDAEFKTDGKLFLSSVYIRLI